LVILQTESNAFLTWPLWTVPPTCASCIARITAMYNHARLVLITLLPTVASNQDVPNLCFLNTWDYMHEPPYLFYTVFFVISYI
jgi:hypothetical protein